MFSRIWIVLLAVSSLASAASLNQDSHTVDLHLAAGLTNTRDAYQPGVTVGFQRRLTDSVFSLGFEAGAYSISETNLGAFIPLAISARANVRLSEKFELTLGLAPGIGIIALDQGSDAYFMALLQPGLAINANPNTRIALQTGLGTLDGSFLFNPTLGVIFLI